MNCPQCNRPIDLPFNIERCPHCDFQIHTASPRKGVTGNPFSSYSEISWSGFEDGTHFLNKYLIDPKTHRHDGIFHYYRVKGAFGHNWLQIHRIESGASGYFLNRIKDLQKQYPTKNDFLVKMISCGVEKDFFYVIWEDFPFNTLQDTFNTTGTLPPELVLQLFLFLLDLYNEGLILPHLFLNPKSIISMGDNRFSILNYLVLQVVAPFIPSNQLFQNTVLPYVAPEMIEGTLLIDKKADLFSIGTLWIEILNNESIFDSISNFSTEVKERLISISNVMRSTQAVDRSEGLELLRGKIEKLLEIVLESDQQVTDMNEHEIELLNEDDLIVEEVQELDKEDITIPPEVETDPEVETPPENEPEEEILELNNFETVEETPPKIAPPPPKINDHQEITPELYQKARERLNRNPLDINHLNTLYQFFLKNNAIDQAYVVSNILKFRDALGEDHPSFAPYKNYLWHEKRPITDNTWLKIVPKDLYFNVSGIMLYLTPFLTWTKVTIPKIDTPDYKSKKLDMETPQGKIITEVLTFLNLKDATVELTKTDIGGNKKTFSQICMKKGKPVIIFKKQIFDNIDLDVFPGIIAKFLSLLHLDMINNFLYNIPVIQEIFYGVLKYLVPSARDMHNSKISSIVYRGIKEYRKSGKMSHNDLIKLVILINEHIYKRKTGPDLNQSMRTLERTSDRIALIFSNNLNNTLKMFIDYGELNLFMGPTERMKSLFKFLLSDPYFETRKELKQGAIL